MLAYALARRNIILNQINQINNSYNDTTYVQTSNNFVVRIYNKIKELFN